MTNPEAVARHRAMEKLLPSSKLAELSELLDRADSVDADAHDWPLLREVS